MKKYLLPLLVFAVLVVFLAVGLTRDPRLVPSPLLNKPLPDFQLKQLHDESKTLGKQDMLGKVWLLNVWASWCVSCRDEHPVWVAFAKTRQVPLVGLDYKDKRSDGIAWLEKFGDPYTYIAQDSTGRTGIDLGVYGVPETYLIDRQGYIRYKYVGAVSNEVLQKELLPRISQLQTP